MTIASTLSLLSFGMTRATITGRLHPSLCCKTINFNQLMIFKLDKEGGMFWPEYA